MVLLLEHLESFKKDAKTYLNKKGAYASVGIGPKGLTSRFFDKEGMDKVYKEKFGSSSYEDLAGQPMFLGQKSNAIFAGMNMILRYHYTYDQDYIRKVYPYLIAVAEFWEDYLTYEDGRYVIYNDSFHEVGPWQGKMETYPDQPERFPRLFAKRQEAIPCMRGRKWLFFGYHWNGLDHDARIDIPCSKYRAEFRS